MSYKHISAAAWVRLNYGRFQTLFELVTNGVRSGYKQSTVREAIRVHELRNPESELISRKREKVNISQSQSDFSKKVYTEEELKAECGQSAFDENESGTANASLKMTSEEVAKLRSRGITIDEHILNKFNVDITRWKLTHIKTKTWLVPVKIKTRVSRTESYETLHKVDILLIGASFERIKSVSKEEELAWFKEEVAAFAPKYEKMIYPSHPAKSRCMVEMSNPDPHIGLLAWDQETLHADWDVSLALDACNKAFDAQLAFAARHEPEQIIIPMGNDLFNVDTVANTTTKGTHQDEDSRWKRTFKAVRQMTIRQIDRARLIAPVKVMVIPGNHDTARAFMFGDVLEARFEQCHDVEVDNSPAVHKAHLYGRNLIGFTHYLGAARARKDWPMFFATRFKKWYASAKYMEVHGGHTHHEDVRGTRSSISKDFYGVRLRDLPSLSPNSAWSTEQLYVSQRESQAFKWEYDCGVSEIFMHRIDDPWQDVTNDNYNR